MNDGLKALVEGRDRNLTRFIDYDLKVLAVLFGIATAWGVVARGGVGRELIEVILAVSGLLMSLGWRARRRLLWRIEDAYVEAMQEALATMASAEEKIAKSLAGLAINMRQLPVCTDAHSGEGRLRALGFLEMQLDRAAQLSLRNGETFAVLFFTFLSFFAVVTAVCEGRTNTVCTRLLSWLG